MALESVICYLARPEHLYLLDHLLTAIFAVPELEGAVSGYVKRHPSTEEGGLPPGVKDLCEAVAPLFCC